ncbi:hypothetical protein [Bradyrhizobium sp. Tv2a-2]|uniref:hypothetical protein n=1 Tax=Bradyrhizobium sp. Tv2a-2 TaxID=113395 RepID=UPI0012EB8EFF|nr:hypothetical protein [Bradyrhizobium sp. Tv2a-2]
MYVKIEGTTVILMQHGSRFRFPCHTEEKARELRDAFLALYDTTVRCASLQVLGVRS